MDNYIPLEAFEEKEKRLEAISRLEVKKEILSRQIQEIDMEIDCIINTDEDYRDYIKKWKDLKFSFRRFNYSKYCSLLKLPLNTTAESESYGRLAELLMISSSGSFRSNDCVFNETLNNKTWAQVLKVISQMLSDTEFKTWIKTLKLLSSGENSIKIAVDNEFSRTIVKDRYEDLLLNAIKELTAKSYKIEYCIGE